jgi:hypothetical protein
MIVTTGRIAEHPHSGRHQLSGYLSRVSTQHLCAAREIGLRYLSCHGIDIDRHDFQTGSSERHGVGADPAAEVDHPANPGLQEPARVVVSYLGSRRLFQTRSGEEHLSGSRAELGPCLLAKRGLGESSRSKLGTETRAHPSGGCQRLGILLRHRRIESLTGQVEWKHVS